MGTKDAGPKWRPHSAPEAVARRANMLGPPNQNDTAHADHANVANTHCNNLRTRRRAETSRMMKALVDQAQDHLRNMRLRKLRLEAKMCVEASGCACDVRKGLDVSR